MIFEWAELGSVLQYLESRLTGSRKDWEIVFDYIEDIAVGLDELHRNNIIHRWVLFSSEVDSMSGT